MWSRRQFLSRSSLAVLGTAGSALAVPADDGGAGGRDALPDGSASRGMITPEADRAIERGLAFLAARRHRDGSFGTNGYTGNTAVTSLAAMAFMAGGHQPNRGAYGRIVTDALRYVLGKENVGLQNPGYLHNPLYTTHGPMYGHGFGTLFLAEGYGMVHDQALRQA